MGFYWSYTLLPEPPVLMHSCESYEAKIEEFEKSGRLLT